MTETPLSTATPSVPNFADAFDSPDDVVTSRLAARARVKAMWLLGVLAVLLVLLAVSGGSQHARLDLGSGDGGPSVSGPVWAFCFVGTVLAVAGAAIIWRSGASRRARRSVVGCVLVVLIAFVVGLLAWAARGSHANVGGVLALSVGGAVPIMLGSTAGVLSERSGVFNIAIEAELLAGAFTAALVGSTSNSAVAGLISGIVAGGAVGLLLAVMSIRYRVDQVVAGIILISLLTGLTGYLTEQVLTPNAAKLNSPAVFGQASVPLLNRLPILGQSVSATTAARA